MATNGNTHHVDTSFPVYLDYNATTPLDDQVVQEISRSLSEDWGNPSSSHVFGERAKRVIEQSRIAVARMVHADPEDIIFTSGGTEANNIALLSMIKEAEKSLTTKPHVITSNVEHDSVARVLMAQEKLGEIDLSIVPVDENGQVHAENLLSLIKENTCGISVMHANNETGVIMPIEEICTQLEKINLLRKKEGKLQILFHCDAAQTIGKVKVNVQSLKVDLLTVVGHKFYAPRIGALYCRELSQRNSNLVSHVFQGGGQERGYRPGTENTPMIAGLGKAAELVHENLESYQETMKGMAVLLGKQLQDSIEGLQINFSGAEKRLPNTVSICLPEGLSANYILNDKCKGKLLASLGAACHSNVEKPSQILIASGLSPSEASRTIRLSVGRTTTKVDVKNAVKILRDACVH